MVDGFSAGSIRAACMLLDYDRASRHGPGGWRPRRIDVDGSTCWNLSRMVARSLAFLDEYGPVVWRDFRFDGGYTDLITSGDGDFLTCDTLWDFKVSKWPPTSMGTLQVLTYWRMGLHSRHPVYRSIRRLGLWNPRLDTAWLLDVDRIGDGLRALVDERILGIRRSGLTACFAGPSPGLWRRAVDMRMPLFYQGHAGGAGVWRLGCVLCGSVMHVAWPRVACFLSLIADRRLSRPVMTTCRRRVIGGVFVR
ncbi:hypothetical protein [Bifidobacterium moukalabense]|uniref:hypothetical protein n=1 Tax=Bifidobacterium moukalabense TaxID=1333651 RepID=UPI00201DB38D|nr:hypothetical protein [Bifidobacterium moukalabense]